MPQVHRVVVGEPQRANPRAGQRDGRGRAEPADPHHEDARLGTRVWPGLRPHRHGATSTTGSGTTPGKYSPRLK